MTLRADAVAPLRIETRGLDDLARRLTAAHHRLDVARARPVTALAPDASFRKRSALVAVLRRGNGAHVRRVARQALGLDRPAEVDAVALAEARRNVPSRRGGIVGNRRLEQEAVRQQRVAATDGARADVEVESSAPADRIAR